MDPRVRLSANGMVSNRFIGRLCASLLLFPFLLAGLGCGAGSKPVVSGKVTLSGQSVSGGTIKFQVGDKEAAAPILDGKYSIDNPPLGEATITISPPLDAGVDSKGLPTGAPGGGGGATTLGGPTGAKVLPPAKYSQPNNGLAKFTIKGGKQTHDIDLTP